MAVERVLRNHLHYRHSFRLFKSEAKLIQRISLLLLEMFRIFGYLKKELDLLISFISYP